MKTLIVLLSCLLLISCNNDFDNVNRSLDELQTRLVILNASATVLNIRALVLKEKVDCLTQPIAYCGD